MKPFTINLEMDDKEAQALVEALNICLGDKIGRKEFSGETLRQLSALFLEMDVLMDAEYGRIDTHVKNCYDLRDKRLESIKGDTE
jgi:hypothetical protein